MARTLIPNDFRDFLSIISFTGFIGIFLFFMFNITWLNDNMTGIFLLLGGSSFLVIGKVFTAKKWLRDGLEQNELAQLLAILVGFTSIVIGILFIAHVELPEKFLGTVGLVALVPAIYTLMDYIAKNRR